MADIHLYTSKEVLNKVFRDSSGSALSAVNKYTTQEALNLVFASSDNALNVILDGFTNPTATTTDATETTLKSISTSNDTAYMIKVLVTGISADGSVRYCAEKSASFYNDGGSLSQLGLTTNGHEEESKAGLDFKFDTNSTNIRLRVTGKAGTTMSWNAVVIQA